MTESVSGRKKTHELFFALVGPVGTDMGTVNDILSKELKALNYGLEVIKMSRLIEGLPDLDPSFQKLPDHPEDERIHSRMKAGDAFRRKVGSGAALAYLAMVDVRLRRTKSPQVPRRAFIFDSLKHPEELRALRRIYGEALICISVFAPQGVRTTNLAHRIARSKGCDADDCKDRANELVKEHQRGGDREFGQNVADTFAMADVFIRHDEHQAMQAQLARLVELLFGHAFRTPSRDEIGMFHARAAALRSADLSRQVGAVLADPDGSLLSSGCNEVPRAGGGTYWEGDDPDYRDFRLGRDANVEQKLKTIQELFEKLKQAGWLNEEQSSKGSLDLATIATAGNGPLDGTRVDSLIEFGRVVHAEMNTLADAAMRGVAVKGATLYCTTFPCHNCARHLLAAGVARVVYIEPYPKSLASKLYKPAIRVDDYSGPECSVGLSFESFVGIAPRRFVPLFDLGSIRRKASDGFVKEWRRSDAEPRFEQLFADHHEREVMFLLELINSLKEAGIPDEILRQIERQHAAP